MRRPRLRFLEYYRQFEALSPEEDSRRLQARARARKAREIELAPRLDMSRSEWHEPPDPEIVNAATFALRRAIHRYPAEAGWDAGAAVAAYHGVAPEQVVVGHGAGELLQAALRAAAFGGSALIAWPAWSPLPALTARAGVRPVTAASDELVGSVDADVRAVVVCSPNDPTGEIADVAALARSLPDDVLLLVDEALIEFAGEEHSAVRLVGEVPRLVVFRSFSKAWAMAGFRAGYAVAGPAESELIAALGPGLGVATPAQAAIAAALDPGGRALARLARRRHALEAERARLAGLLRGLPFEAAPSLAHFVWLRGEGIAGPDLAHDLAEQRIDVAPGSEWGDGEHVRVTLRDRAATERLVSALRTIAG